MERPEILRREIRALVFDQYGTIVDMQKGLTEIAEPFLRAKGWTGNATVSSRGGGAPIMRTR